MIQIFHISSYWANQCSSFTKNSYLRYRAQPDQSCHWFWFQFRFQQCWLRFRFPSFPKSLNPILIPVAIDSNSNVSQIIWFWFQHQVNTFPIPINKASIPDSFTTLSLTNESTGDLRYFGSHIPSTNLLIDTSDRFGFGDRRIRISPHLLHGFLHFLYHPHRHRKAF